MTSHKPNRWLLRVAIVLLIVVLLFVADLTLVRWRQSIHSGYDTTRVTGPVQADGSVDYLKALEDHFSQGVTPENNAAIPILQALGPEALPSDQPRDGITDRLGMAPLPLKGDYYITYGDYFRSRAIDDDTDAIGTTKPLTWPMKIDPAIGEWAKANEKPLGLLKQASTRSRYFIPFNGGNRPKAMISILLPHVPLLRDAQRALLSRALLRLSKADTSGFAEDILTAHRLARLLGQDSTMVGRIIAQLFERATCRVQRVGIASGRLSPQQVRQMLDELAQMGDLPSFIECVDYGERFIVLDALQVLARSDDKGRAELFNGLFNSRNPDIVFRFWPIDYNECMAGLNKGYDDSIAALRQPTWREQRQARDYLDLEIDFKRRQGMMRLMLSSDWPLVMLLPAMNNASERFEGARIEGRLTQLALALELFKSEHGEYPASLAELSPRFLPQIPNDLFSNAPLIYAPKEKGYTLYSVGPNMTDDHEARDDLSASLNWPGR